MPRQPHDRFFKQLLASPDAALALFGMVLPAGVLDGVRPEDLRHGDGALTAHWRVRYPDRLYGLRLPGRTRLLILAARPGHAAAPAR